ncbi:MAG TPA: hypothetical protein ENK57_22120 [Polyangiaceae bacterium]|nr:hypothetical protein [Polyangiaceae bacterium]
MRESKLPLLIAALVGLGLAAVIAWPGSEAEHPELPAPALVPPPAFSSRPDPSVPDAGEPLAPPVSGDDALCPLGMTLVEALYCPFVAHRCEDWLDPRPKNARERASARCQRYEDRLLCEGRPSRHAFCIDRYEYPNLPGMKPAILVSYRDAERACEVEGKRLCAQDEWQLACEGHRTYPYPTGLVRDASRCNIDRRPRRPDPAALDEPHDLAVEVERLDQRMPSGALVDCVSPFGVFDMSGNVAEWVFDRAAESLDRGRPTAIAGGHWGRSVATCRELDNGHGASFRRYDVGFRCCADPLDGRDVRGLMGKEYRLPKRRRISEPDASASPSSHPK